IVPGGTGTVTQITGGDQDTCAIKTSGTPVCWGNPGDGKTNVPDGIGPDITPPVAPSGLSTDPGSPGQSGTPKVKGTAEAGSTVKGFDNSSSTGSPAATGSAADFGSAGLTVAAVADGSTTSYYATATDQVGNTSAC